MTNTIIFPSGIYLIVDPCYVLHESWSEICNRLFLDLESSGDLTLTDGRRIFISNTAYGDGVYSDNIGNLYGVDSGCLGIVSWSDINQDDPKNDVTLGILHTFADDFTVTCDNGVFMFGDVVIDTAGNVDDIDDYWNFDCE